MLIGFTQTTFPTQHLSFPREEFSFKKTYAHETILLTFFLAAMSAKRLWETFSNFKWRCGIDYLLPFLSHVRHKDTCGLKGNDLTIWVILPPPPRQGHFALEYIRCILNFVENRGESPEISHFMCDIFVITLTCCDNLRRRTCRLRINLSKYVKNYQNTQNNKECSSDRMGRRSDTDCFPCSHHLTIIFFCN